MLLRESEDDRGFVGRCHGTTNCLAQRHGFRHKIDIVRRSVTKVELEPEVQVSSLFQGGPNDRTVHDVASDHGDSPRDITVLEQLQVRVQGAHGWRQSERSTEVPAFGREVQLDHGAFGQLARAPPCQCCAQKARFINGETRSESVFATNVKHA